MQSYGAEDYIVEETNKQTKPPNQTPSRTSLTSFDCPNLLETARIYPS